MRFPTAVAVLLALGSTCTACAERSLLPNSNFECGRDGWVLSGWPVPKIGADPRRTHSGIQDVQMPNGAWLSSTWFPLAPNTTYTFQVYARGSGSILLQLKDYNSTFSGGGPIHQQSVRLTDAARFLPYSLIYKTGDKPDNGIVYVGSYGSDIALDDVSVVASSASPVPYQPRADTEFGIANSAPYGVVTAGGRDSAALTVTTSNPAVRGTYLCRIDETGHQWGASWLKFAQRPGGLRQAVYEAQDLPPGYWHFVTSPTSAATHALGRVEGETFLLVVPPMPEAPLSRWFYGSHVTAGDNAMQKAVWKMGMRWDRLHDTDQSLAWGSCEPKKGQWNYNKAGVAWHKGTAERPFGLVGDIDKDWVPDWVPMASPKYARSLNNLDPSELQDGQDGSDWYTLCASLAANEADSLATTYGGGVPAYLEISNEPDNGYVAAWDPPLTPAAYVQELKVAYSAIKKVTPDVQVVAQGSFAYPDGSTFRDEIAAGLLNYCDVVTYHGYGFDIDASGTGIAQSGGKSPRYGGAYQRTAVQKLKDEMGQNVKPIWGDEAGTYGMASCFEKYPHPYLASAVASDPGAFRCFPNLPYNSLANEEARGYAASACVSKASGTQRMIYYEANGVNDEAAEINTNTIRWGDVNDVMKEPLEALAVAVSLLQGMDFTSGTHDERTGLVHLAYAAPVRGADAARRLDVYWIDPSHTAPVTIDLASNAKSPMYKRRINIWGRREPLTASLTVGQDPVYVVSETISVPVSAPRPVARSYASPRFISALVTSRP